MDFVSSDLKQALPVPPEAQNGSPALDGDGSLAVVHIEVCQKPMSTAKEETVKQHVYKLLQQHMTCVSDFTLTKFDNDPFLQENVVSVSVTDSDVFHRHNKQGVPLTSATMQLHVFQLQEDGPAQEDLDDDDDISAANHWLLPSTEFHGLWESLIFDSTVKSELLRYAAATLLFSDKNVDSNIVSWNKVILLHGPPGTGKTSLCQALAQKLCIHLSHRYSYGQLIEINSHSLFSKWFSESGKLVMKMFQKIQELVDDKEALVFVLIDEVESLTAARKASMAGTEPSDAIRVVNALLTQLDQIKKNSNVLILTTSNITGAIDLAFVDRADIKQYIGLPSPAAIYKIYQSCLIELMRAGIISPSEQLLDLNTLSLMQCRENAATRLSLKLKHAAIKSEGLSGRTLRKLPFIAHALFLQGSPVTLDHYLDALTNAAVRQFQDREDLTKEK